MPERYRRRIIDHLADPRYRPRQVEELAQTLGIDEAELEAFEDAVRKLIDEGQILLGDAETVVLPPPGREMEGTFRLNPRGFGFLVPDSPMEHGDLFVPQGNTADAMTGDRVRAKVLHDRRRAGEGRSPYIGRIVEVLVRADKHYVGNLAQVGGRWVVHVDGQALPDPVVIRDPHAKNAKAGDKVVIELTQYPDGDRAAEGVITEVLGEHGQPDVETQATMRAYGLKEAFPPNVMDEARAAARHFDDQRIPADRLDLTGEFILTIDPPDAKDYDDAISIRRLERAGPSSAPAAPGAVWELGVHIAHVAHFVPTGGTLDKEAAQRGNSSYLPRKVVPMLPEMLSNGVCSLQEGVNRFCLSAFIQYDARGKVVAERFARTVIRSAKRLTYLEAQALIDGDLREAKKHAKTEPKYGGPLIEKLKQMDELSKVIRQRRFDEGMIVLDLPEVELVFDDSGRVVDAQPEDNAYTHKLIEMFMVEANEAAARLFHRLDVPMIRRIHPDPDAHDVGELRNFARVAGFNIPMRPSRKELQQLLDGVRGKPAQRAVHIAVLRTLSKAEYAPTLIGHFALASEHYTHFTSPIRRYPDLIVHRGLDAYLDAVNSRGSGDKSSPARQVLDDRRVPNEERLHEIGRHCSTTERNSESAERDLRTYLVLELLCDHLGDDFGGTVTGMSGGGLFIQLDKYLVDGFVRIGDLPWRGERWRLNPNTGMLVAQGSGKTISIGDTFVVRIAKVDPVARRLELAIIPPDAKPGEGKKSVKKKRTQPPGAAQAHQQTMRLKQRPAHRRGGKKRRRK